MITARVTALQVHLDQQRVMPLFLSYLAIARAELGQLDDAWRCIGEAMNLIETAKESGSRPRPIASQAKSR